MKLKTMSRICLSIVLLLTVVGLASCDRNEGRRIFRQAIQLWEEGQLKYREGLSKENGGQDFEESEKKYDEAIQNFVALTKAYPNHDLVDDALFLIGNIYDHYLKEPGRAIRYYRIFKNFEGKSDFYFPAMQALARLYSSQGEKDKSVRIYQKLQKIIRSHGDRFNKVLKRDCSLPELKPAANGNDLTRLDSENDFFCTWDQNQYLLARIYYNEKQYKQARIELKKLIETHPNSKFMAQAYYLIGNSYYLEGSLKLAQLTFSETEKKFYNSPESFSSALSLAAVFEEQGKLRAAIGIYEKIKDRLRKSEVSEAESKLDSVKSDHLFSISEYRIRRLRNRGKIRAGTKNR